MIDFEKTPTLAFKHLNLRFNPFCETPVENRSAYATVRVREYIRLLDAPKVVIQFVGEKGHGKTTNLLAIYEHFSDSHYLHIGEGERPGAIPTCDMLFIDEAQRLGWFLRRQIFRRSCRLIIATHVDFSRELLRAGRVVHSIEVKDLLSDDDLHLSFNRRVQFGRRSEGPIPQISHSTVRELRKRFGSDIRAMEWELYDRFQHLEELTNV